MINKINGSIKKSNQNKYLTLFFTDESKDALKNMMNHGIKSETSLDK